MSEAMPARPAPGDAKLSRARPTGQTLRSAAWLGGDDEVAVLHRVALASAGVRGRPGQAGDRDRELR